MIFERGRTVTDSGFYPWNPGNIDQQLRPIDLRFYNYIHQNEIGIAEGDQDNIEKTLPTDQILKMVSPEGIYYYEGYQHNEHLLMLDDFFISTKTAPQPVFQVLVDEHDELTSKPIEWDFVDEANWPVFQEKIGWLDNRDRRDLGLEMGMLWISRFETDNSEYQSTPSAISRLRYAVSNKHAVAINLTIYNFDRLMEDPWIILEPLVKAKQNGLIVSVTIDADAGNNSIECTNGRSIGLDRTWFKTEERDLFNSPVLEMCALADMVSFVHSPGYADQNYSLQQAILFRNKHLQGYQEERERLFSEYQERLSKRTEAKLEVPRPSLYNVIKNKLVRKR